MCTHTYIYTYTQTNTNKHTQTNTHKHTHIYIYTYTHQTIGIMNVRHPNDKNTKKLKYTTDVYKTGGIKNVCSSVLHIICSYMDLSDVIQFNQCNSDIYRRVLPLIISR
jgi:hypothetical protein